MYRAIALIMAAILTLSLTACSGDTTPGSTPAPSSTSPSSAQQSASSAPQTEQPDSPYSMKVKITGEKTAEILLEGVNVQLDGDGTQWRVGLDDNLYIGLACYEGNAQCDLLQRENNADGSFNLPIIGQARYEIGDGTLLLYADFSMVADFDFNKVAAFSTAIDEDNDGEVSYTPFTYAPADVVVTELASAPAGGTSQPASGNASSAAADTPATDKTSIQDFVGTYIQTGTDNSFVLTDTYQFTNIKVIDPIYKNEDNSGHEVSSVFGVADVVGGTVKISTNYGCNLVANFNGDGSITLFLTLGDKQFTGKFISADQAPKELSDFSQIAGFYKGGWSTLTIQANGAFTYEHNSDSLKKTFTGQLPTGLKSGDKVQSNDYSIVFHFSPGASNMSIDVKDASGTSVGGDDLSKTG